MNDDILEIIKNETLSQVRDIAKDDLKQIILFGSCARGDYTEESDIDIAVLVDGDRSEAERFRDALVMLSAKLDLIYMVVVNYICLPKDEFDDKKDYYPFYSNIAKEGMVIYG